MEGASMKCIVFGNKDQKKLLDYILKPTQCLIFSQYSEITTVRYMHDALV